MNEMPSRAIVEYRKELYKVGTEVELVLMDDIQAPPVGTRGKVMFVDDIGTVHVEWDNGSSLGAAFGEDLIRIV